MTRVQEDDDLDEVLAKLISESTNTQKLSFSEAMKRGQGAEAKKTIGEQQHVDASEFYEAILPELREDCSYGVSTLDAKGHWNDYEVRSRESLLKISEQHTAKGDNVFVAMNTFNRNNELGKFSRQAKYADQGQCIWADIDCDHGSTLGQYQTKEVALAAIEAVTGEDAIPKPTYVVDSGHGFHLYWVLDRPMNSLELKILAADFEKMLTTAGLKMDARVTTDMARVLRAIDSYNMKEE